LKKQHHIFIMLSLVCVVPNVVKASVAPPSKDAIESADGQGSSAPKPEADRSNPAQFSPQLERAIKKAAERHRLPPETLRAFAAIESNGNPRASRGSYHGVYQLSHSLFRKYGGHGSIFDIESNTDVAARKLREESDAFAKQHGREPSAAELYMIHQQGIGGAQMHMANPDLPAWQNMYRTGEGQKKGPSWARLAIWGNVPLDQRARFPRGVDAITSREFMAMWAHKMARFGGGEAPASMGAKTAEAQVDS
jgi:hypothetical protein